MDLAIARIVPTFPENLRETKTFFGGHNCSGNGDNGIECIIFTTLVPAVK